MKPRTSWAGFRFLPLKIAELRRAPELHPTSSSPFPTRTRPSPDQFALEFGETTEDRQHEPAMRRGGVGPAVVQALKAGLGIRDLRQDVEQIPRASGQPIEPAHHQHVAGFQFGDRFGELGPIGADAFSAACLTALAGSLNRMRVRHRPQDPVRMSLQRKRSKQEFPFSEMGYLFSLHCTSFEPRMTATGQLRRGQPWPRDPQRPQCPQ
jgi:hypothetical protein